MSESGGADIERFLASHGPFEKAPLLRSGETVGDWRVTAFLGRGATSEVYRAENTVTRQVGAVKLFMRGDERALARFRREVALLAQMDCASLPRFYGAGVCDGRAFVATELLECADLPSKDSDVARFILGVCAGVEALHAQGYVHRDVKPRNVMRRPSTGEPVLIDIGLAKEADESPHAIADTLSVVDGHAVGVGTIGYSAPEQFSGGKIGATADVHALGMLANACFKSRPPRVWAEIIRRSTSSAPEQRYATVAAFARAVRRRHWARQVLAAVAGISIVVVVAAVLDDGAPKGENSRRDAEALRDVKRSQDRQDERHASSRLDRASAETAKDLISLGSTKRENGANVTTIQLNNRDITIPGETILNKGQQIVVIGPGRVTASVSGERGATIELRRRATLINLTTKPYTESSMKYVLTGDAYLNFKNLDSPLDGDIKNVWVDNLTEKGTPIVNFRGLDSVDFEKAKAINEAAWSKAIENGNFW